MFGASHDVVAYLVEKYPSASEMVDTDGMMPLHLACDVDHLNAYVVKILVQANPGACTVRSITNGWTPLVFALTNVGNLDIVKMLGDANDEAHKIMDHEQNTALHVAITSAADVDVCQYLVDANPAAVSTKNEAGETPLVLAARLGADQAIIEVLKSHAIKK
jgi:ankyrin repeat protein